MLLKTEIEIATKRSLFLERFSSGHFIELKDWIMENEERASAKVVDSLQGTAITEPESTPFWASEPSGLTSIPLWKQKTSALSGVHGQGVLLDPWALARGCASQAWLSPECRWPEAGIPVSQAAMATEEGSVLVEIQGSKGRKNCRNLCRNPDFHYEQLALCWYIHQLACWPGLLVADHLSRRIIYWKGSRKLWINGNWRSDSAKRQDPGESWHSKHQYQTRLPKTQLGDSTTPINSCCLCWTLNLHKSLQVTCARLLHPHVTLQNLRLSHCTQLPGCCREAVLHGG